MQRHTKTLNGKKCKMAQKGQQRMTSWSMCPRRFQSKDHYSDHRSTGPQMCRSTNMYFCRKKPIMMMHSDATKSPVPVGKGGGRGIRVTTNLITVVWMSHNYTPATVTSDALVLIYFTYLFFLFIPASAYQWRWVWEQRQRSSGSVSGSCRQNALGCCGLSGIRGRGETWAGQHVERERRGQFEHKQWVKSQYECSQTGKKRCRRTPHHCNIVAQRKFFFASARSSCLVKIN